jgi:phage gp16-like protein
MAQTITKRQIQFIQTQRRSLGIDDAVYDEMKASIGVKSTCDLTPGQFEDLLRRMKGTIIRASSRKRRAGSAAFHGGDSYKPVHRSAYASGMHRQPPQDGEAMVSKIEAILSEFGLPWSYADAIAKQQSGGRVEFLRFCDVDQTYKVLQALCMHQKRKRGAGSGKQ